MNRAIFCVLCLVACLVGGICKGQEASSFPAVAQIKVNITGEVEKPGTYLLPAGANVASAINAAGGYARIAGAVRVIRSDGQGQKQTVIHCVPANATFRARFKDAFLIDGDEVSAYAVFY